MTNTNLINLKHRFIYVFDFDDTMIRSNASFIKVRSTIDNNVIRLLTAKQYSNYVLNNNEHFDFSDFDNDNIPDVENLIINKQIQKIFNEAIEAYGSDSVHICSARQNPKPIRTVIDNLFKQPLVKVAAVGTHDDTGNPTVTNAIRKRDYIEQLILNNHKQDNERLVIYFYDDNDHNLEKVNALNDMYNPDKIRVVCLKVDDVTNSIAQFLHSNKNYSSSSASTGTSTTYLQAP